MKVFKSFCKRIVDSKLEEVDLFRTFSLVDDLWKDYHIFWSVNEEIVKKGNLDFSEFKPPCIGCPTIKSCRVGEFTEFKNPVLILFHEREIE